MIQSPLDVLILSVCVGGLVAYTMDSLADIFVKSWDRWDDAEVLGFTPPAWIVWVSASGALFMIGGV